MGRDIMEGYGTMLTGRQYVRGAWYTFGDDGVLIG